MNFKGWIIEASFTRDVNFENPEEEKTVRSEVEDKLNELIFKCDYMPIVGTFIESSYEYGLVLEQISFYAENRIMFLFIESPY